MASNGFIAFMQGFTGAGLFGKLRRPGAPTEFMDSRSVEEYIDSGDFERTLSRYRVHIPERPAQPDYVKTWPEVTVTLEHVSWSKRNMKEELLENARELIARFQEEHLHGG